MRNAMLVLWLFDLPESLREAAWTFIESGVNYERLRKLLVREKLLSPGKRGRRPTPKTRIPKARGRPRIASRELLAGTNREVEEYRQAHPGANYRQACDALLVRYAARTGASLTKLRAKVLDPMCHDLSKYRTEMRRSQKSRK